MMVLRTESTPAEAATSVGQFRIRHQTRGRAAPTSQFAMAADGTDQRGLKRGRSPTPDAECADSRDDYDDEERARMKREFFDKEKRRLKSAATPPKFKDGFTLADFWKGWGWLMTHIEIPTNNRRPEYLSDRDCNIPAYFLNEHEFYPESFASLSQSALIDLVREWNKNASPMRQLKFGVVLHVHHVVKKWLGGGGVEERLDGIRDALVELRHFIEPTDMSLVEQRLNDINATLEWAGNKMD